MPHPPGPYVKHPQRDGFRISTAANMHLADVPPLGFAARNKVGREMIEATANLFAAAPAMLQVLQAIARNTDANEPALAPILHVIRLATKGPADSDEQPKPRATSPSPKETRP